MRSSQFERLIEYTTHAASAAQEISDSAQIPFLGVAGTMSLAILRGLDSVKTNKEECMAMVEQIHEILCTIVSLCSVSQINGVLSPTLLIDVSKFTEGLRNLYTFVVAQQGTGKIKQFLKQLDNAARLKACRQEMNHLVTVFRLHSRASAVEGISQMVKDAEQQHQDLLALLATYPELTNSDLASLKGSTFSNDSTMSLSMLPASPQIFHGREPQLDQVLAILQVDSPRLAILGMGGMGKTTLAAAALNHPDIVAKFSSRYFISCQSTATAADLVSLIASHIGIGRGSNPSAGVFQHFKDGPSTLLVLDNFETLWESTASQAKAEDFLSLLADVPHLALVITMRGAERPQKVKWSRPFLAPLQPLSNSAAKAMFFDIADQNDDETVIRQLLEFTGNLPLAVSLMANVAACEGCEKTLERWQTERTRLLSDGYDKRSSLDISIMLSFSGTRMTTDAQELLALLSTLPDGLSEAELIQCELPIANLHLCKATLLRTSLAYLNNKKRLTVLVPIREYVRNAHPPSAETKAVFLDYIIRTVELFSTYDARLALTWDLSTQVSTVVGNFQAVLVDALKEDGEKSEAILRSVVKLSHLMSVETATLCPLLDAVEKDVKQLQGRPIYGLFLIEKFWGSATGNLPGVEYEIAGANEYFERTGGIEKAQWFNALGAYYFRNNDLRQSLHYVQLAVALTTSLTYPTREAMVASQSAVMLLDILGDPVAAKIHAQRAQAFAELLGDVCGRVQSICYEIRLCCSVGNFQHAAKLFAEIDALVPAAGATRSLVLQTVEEVRIDFHIQKTEYPEALKMVLASLHSKETARPSVRDTALDHINVAFMSNMTGAQREVVASHLDAVRAQCTTFVNWPSGLQSCEIHSAFLDIREGNVATARPILEKTFKFFFESQDHDNIGLCLEQLADHTHGMYDLDTTLHWVCVYLACGLGTSNTWTTIHALRCMGTFSSAYGDDETAFSVFQVALDGFTLMDVHMGKGKCMAGMAEILERKGEIARAKELWRASRPMFERSGQARSVAQVDASLAVLGQKY